MMASSGAVSDRAFYEGIKHPSTVILGLVYKTFSFLFKFSQSKI
jgi:hypothetical protein